MPVWDVVDNKQVSCTVPKSKSAPMAVLYYNSSTVYAGSLEPLSTASRPRNVPRTGWGPRGDSGPERDRVRATQPAKTKPR